MEPVYDLRISSLFSVNGCCRAWVFDLGCSKGTSRSSYSSSFSIDMQVVNTWMATIKSKDRRKMTWIFEKEKEILMSDVIRHTRLKGGKCRLAAPQHLFRTNQCY
jgi:hypothetical protein